MAKKDEIRIPLEGGPTITTTRDVSTVNFRVRAAEDDEDSPLGKGGSCTVQFNLREGSTIEIDPAVDYEVVLVPQSK